MLTLANAACGFGAITFAARIGPANVNGNELLIASLLIYLAMLFDALDGSAARWARQSSDFGAQLDSLCDGLSFGAAPAFLMLQLMRYRFSDQLAPAFTYHPRLLWVIAVLFMACALLRLARFNVETDEDDSHDFFSGLPSPAAAGVVASFPIALYGLDDLLDGGLSEAIGQWLIPTVKILLPWITLAAAFLMVSRVRYPHVFNQFFRGQRSRQHIIQLLFAVVAIVVVHELAVPIIFCFFAFAAPARILWTEATRGRWFRTRREERAS
jgi:CDP-diacylglycerol--serine O-phosphatidyltransferase